MAEPRNRFSEAAVPLARRERISSESVLLGSEVRVSESSVWAKPSLPCVPDVTPLFLSSA